MMEAGTEDKAGGVFMGKPVRAAACETKQLSLFMSLSRCVSSSLCGCWVKLKVNLPLKWQQHCVNLPIHLKYSPRVQHVKAGFWCEMQFLQKRLMSFKTSFHLFWFQVKVDFPWLICFTLIKDAHRPEDVMQRGEILSSFFEKETDTKGFKHRKMLLFFLVKVLENMFKDSSDGMVSWLSVIVSEISKTPPLNLIPQSLRSN